MSRLLLATFALGATLLTNTAISAEGVRQWAKTDQSMATLVSQGYRVVFVQTSSDRLDEVDVYTLQGDKSVARCREALTSGFGSVICQVLTEPRQSGTPQ